MLSSFTISVLLIGALNFGYTAKQKDLCPKIPYSTDFNFQKWSLKPWFVVHVTDPDGFGFYEGKTCIKQIFKLVNDSTDEIKVKTMSFTNNTNLTEVLYGCLGKPPASSIFFHSHNGENGGLEYRIIQTNNKYYSVAFSCVHGKNGERIISVVIFTRCMLDCETDSMALNIRNRLRAFGVKIHLRELTWDGCPDYYEEEDSE